MIGKGRAVAAAAAVAVAAWGLFTAPAAADGEPATTPTLTAPADGSNVAGDVQLSATSVEAQVQFYENGVAFGAPVATSGGVATTNWPTWGDANGGPVVWTAADCNVVGCSSVQSTPVSVNVLNDAPSITSPVDGSTVGPLPTFSATVGGGSLAFTLDGSLLGIDSTPPYEIPAPNLLADGLHSMWVTACNAAGDTCNGPNATTNFTVVTPTLHPAITAVTPNPFSPRVDGRNDTTSFRVHLPDAENVTWSIRNALAQTVNGPHNAGHLGAGDHVFTWNGRNNANQILGDGTYTIVVSTSAPSGALTLHGTATATVRLDDTASALRIVSGNGATFYPVVDGYLDTFGPKVSVNEAGTVWLYVYTTRGAVITLTGLNHSTAGTFQLRWNGRNRANVLEPAGAYRFRFVSQDKAGNRSATGLGTVYVSLRHLVTKSVTLTKTGNARAVVGTTDVACTGYTTSSNFPGGLAIGNWCDENVAGPQLVVAEYVFGIPAAIRYNSIRLVSRGLTDSAPQVLGGLIYNFPTQEFDLVGTSSLGGNNVALTSNYGAVGLAGKVNASRQVKVGVAVGDGPGTSVRDYDIATVTIVLSYSVLN